MSSATGSGASTPGAPNLDWAVPQQTRMKYLSTFQQTDRARTGFIAGVQVSCQKKNKKKNEYFDFF